MNNRGNFNLFGALVTFIVVFAIIRGLGFIGAYVLVPILAILIPVIIYMLVARKTKPPKSDSDVNDVEWHEVKCDSAEQPAEEEKVRCTFCGAPNQKKGTVCPYCGKHIL